MLMKIMGEFAQRNGGTGIMCQKASVSCWSRIDWVRDGNRFADLLDPEPFRGSRGRYVIPKWWWLVPPKWKVLEWCTPAKGIRPLWPDLARITYICLGSSDCFLLSLWWLLPPSKNVYIICIEKPQETELSPSHHYTSVYVLRSSYKL